MWQAKGLNFPGQSSLAQLEVTTALARASAWPCGFRACEKPRARCVVDWGPRVWHRHPGAVESENTLHPGARSGGVVPPAGCCPFEVSMCFSIEGYPNQHFLFGSLKHAKTIPNQHPPADSRRVLRLSLKVRQNQRPILTPGPQKTNCVGVIVEVVRGAIVLKVPYSATYPVSKGPLSQGGKRTIPAMLGGERHRRWDIFHFLLGAK